MLKPVYMAVCDGEKCNELLAAGMVGTGNMVTSCNVLIDNGWTIKNEKHYCPECSRGEAVNLITKCLSNLKRGYK